MILRIATIAAAITLLVGTTIPTTTFAQTTKNEETKKETKKELTPQQKKMKDCAAKWGDEKKSKKVKGRKAYNEFMSGCLKG